MSTSRKARAVKRKIKQRGNRIKRKPQEEKQESIPLIPHMYLRQMAFYNPMGMAPRVLVIGAGGIGSWVVQNLVKLGIRDIHVMDDDVVSLHNLSTTPFTLGDINKPKVTALAGLAYRYGTVITTTGKRYVAGEPLPDSDIVISGVDSMSARLSIFQQTVIQGIPFFIDGRIGGEELRVYSIRPTNPDDVAFYLNTIVADSEAAQLPCLAQQVIDVGSMIASLITRATRKWVVQQTYEPEILAHVGALDIMVSDPKLP